MHVDISGNKPKRTLKTLLWGLNVPKVDTCRYYLQAANGYMYGLNKKDLALMVLSGDTVFTLRSKC